MISPDPSMFFVNHHINNDLPLLWVCRNQKQLEAREEGDMVVAGK
jgi:hypothetical protein